MANAEEPGTGEGLADATIDVPLADLAEAAGISTGLRDILAGPHAPVRLPDQEQLEVHLVTRQQLTSAFEAASDRSLHTNVLLLAVGALIGFMTNVATATTFTWGSGQIAYITAVGTVACVFAALSVRSSQRVRRHRAELLPQPGVNHEH